MTVQSVGSFTASLKAVSNQAAATAAATDSFSSVMNEKSKINSTETKQTASTQKTKDLNRISEKSCSSTDAKQSVSDANTAKTNKETALGTRKNELPDEKSMEEITTKVEKLEEILGQIATLLNSITSLLTNELNVSEEELTQAGLELDLEPVDLLQAKGLKDIFLKLNSAEAEELLTNEELLESFNALQEKADELLGEIGNLDDEIFKTVMTETAKAFENPEFVEVVNEYLLGAETTEPEEELPEIEVVDLRNKPEALKNEAEPLENDSNEAKTVKTVKDAEEKSDAESRNDRKDEAFVKANDFVKNLAAAKENGDGQGISEEVRPNSFRELYDITGQTIRQMKLTLTQETSRMEIQLNPEHLGKVDVQINSKNGAVTAEITAHTEAAKRALEAGLEELKLTLQDTGLKVENVEVTLADYGFRQRDDSERGANQGNGRQGRRRNTEDINGDSSIRSDFEAVSEIMKELNGNNVDYIA